MAWYDDSLTAPPVAAELQTQAGSVGSWSVMVAPSPPATAEPPRPAVPRPTSPVLAMSAITTAAQAENYARAGYWNAKTAYAAAFARLGSFAVSAWMPAIDRWYTAWSQIKNRKGDFRSLLTAANDAYAKAQGQTNVAIALAERKAAGTAPAATSAQTASPAAGTVPPPAGGVARSGIGAGSLLLLAAAAVALWPSAPAAAKLSGPPLSRLHGLPARASGG